MRKRIFISSVQRELFEEREAVVRLISSNPQLARFFDTFAFEFNVPATDKRTDEVYLAELAVSDLYICIIGNEYGGVTVEGISATESEYDEATRLGIPRFCFVKGATDENRTVRECAFLRKISPDLIRVRFEGTEKLLSALTESLDCYLAENKVAYAGQTYEEEPVGKWNELDIEKIQWFVRTARKKRGFPFTEDAPVEKVLTHLKMVTDGVPNRAAMLCFGRDAQLYAVSPGVKCVLWYGRERSKPAGSYKWFEGNLFDVSDKATEFVKEKLNLRIGGHSLGARSNDSFEIDEKIVAEMINNGIAHRDYASSATVQVELFKDRLSVFSPGPMHKDMRFESLTENHQSYAVNPIIAHALFYVQYIEELGTGTVDIFNICKKTGLQPPVFEADARHFNVTVFRPVFNELGNPISLGEGEVGPNNTEVGPNNAEVGPNNAEVGPNNAEVGPNNAEVGPNNAEVGPNPDFEFYLSRYRKDFRFTCKRVWECLASDSQLSRREISVRLKIADSSIQSAMNALQEVGLLKIGGYGKGRKWFVCFPPSSRTF